MKYVAVSRAAADEIISDRFLQSTEFESGLTLANFLQGNLRVARVSARVRVVPSPDGYFFVVPGDTSSQYVVFDVEESKIFSARFREQNILLHLQKTLRFCAKLWGNLKPSVSELFLQNSTKAVVFPYPISQQTSLRLSLELAPDSKRLSKRGTSARRYILVYRCGIDEGGGPQEEARLTNFRRFLDAVPAVAQSNSIVDENVPVIKSLAVTTLDGQMPSKSDEFQGYQRWLQLLTIRQKEFVEAELRAPHRIEGPAGTGKTLCLILKCIFLLRKAELESRELRALFITHSDATRRTVAQIFAANDERDYLHGEAGLRPQSVNVTTLHQLCGSILRQDISESEFIDRDAMESKQLQLLYVSEAVARAIRDDLPAYQRLLSPSFDRFLHSTDEWTIAEMVQHEISVVIKGRAEEKLDNYRKFPKLRYGLPTEIDSDRGFVWMIFKKYQDQLQKSAQFDTDDIVLTTIGQLNTPIWRRRRLREGYDSILIDETHLFNLNELSLFHHLPRIEAEYPIAYSVDRSQAIGDRGWSDGAFDTAISSVSEASPSPSLTEVGNIFRCSPEIIDLAFSVTSAGATLFTNFKDPLELATSAFTSAEERKCATPTIVACANDSDLLEHAFLRSEKMARDMEVPRSGVAIVAFSDELFRMACKFAEDHNKSVELLKERGDVEVLQRAQQSGRFVLTTPDYVGGLEFDGVMLLGVDEGRVPPAYTVESADSRNFLSYASHNRLYVAITRAKYRVEIFRSRERGNSPLLRNALKNHLLVEVVADAN